MSPRKTKLQVVAGKRAIAPGVKPPAKPAAQSGKAASRPTAKGAPSSSAPPQISGRWLLLALSAVLAAAAVCAWGVLCLLFWQGSWQLLYHPSSNVARTPASIGLPFDPIGFATTGSGLPRLNGWWIPAAPGSRFSRYTLLHLHGQDGNLGDTVDHLAQLHAAGVNVFAFDYRGYGRSRFAHPSEKHWLEDAGWALQYLTATRHIDPRAIVLDGSNLGADLALEFAASHSELAGVLVESPLEDATRAIFGDARTRLLPAHLLVSDRWDLAAPAAALRIPSLWFLPFPDPAAGNGLPENPEVFRMVSAPKMFVWLPPAHSATANFPDELSRWLDNLPAR